MDFKELLEYNEASNNAVIEKLQEYEVYDEVFDTLISHILNAHEVWNSRILVKSPRYDIWQIHPRTDLKDINLQLHLNTGEILETVDKDQVIHYTNSKEKPYSNSMKEIIYHLLNHSNYHRAQINMKLRENRIEPAITDYIYFKRKG